MQLENTFLYETIQEIGLNFSELSIELTRILQHPAEKHLIIDVLVKDIMDQVLPNWEDFPITHSHKILQLQRELRLLCADVEVLNKSIKDPTLFVTGVNLISTNTFVLEFNLDEIYR